MISEVLFLRLYFIVMTIFMTIYAMSMERHIDQEREKVDYYKRKYIDAIRKG